MGTLISCCSTCFFITSASRRGQLHQSHFEDGSPWYHRPRQVTTKQGHSEFLRWSPKMSPRGNMWNTPKISPSWSNSPVKGVVSPSPLQGTMDQTDYYSTFHKTRNQKRFTKEQWEDFTRESTRQAIAGLAASPEFTDWIVEHADRIQLIPSDNSSDESVGSESDCTDENVGSSNRFRLFNW